jgi:MFS family permease
MYDRGHRGAVMIACAGAFVAFLDTTIVNIAFPDISASFAGSGRDALSWVLDGYFVVIAALLVPAGGLADRFGHRRVFMLGIASFTAASLLCAVGGALVELSDWRLVFLVNLPLGAAILFAARRRLPERPVRDSRLPDLPGALMLALALALVTLGIVEGNDWGWTAVSTLASFVVGAVLLAAVIGRGRTHPRPIVEPALFAHRSFRIGNLGTLLFSAAFFSIVLGNVLFLTSIWGYTVLQAGLATLPGPAWTTVVSGPAGKLADRFGHRAVVVPGTLLFAAGVMVLRSAGPDPDWLGLWLPGATLTGIGIGLAFPTLGSAAVRDVAIDRFATASAVNAAFRQIGAVLGTAILIAIVGDPTSLGEALSVSDGAYLFAVIAALVAGAVTLTLRPLSTPAGADDTDRREASSVAYETAST